MRKSIPPEFIQEVLSRVDIVELIDTRVSLRKAGVNFKANCPFHEEDTPSFVVSPQKQIYTCFGCGAKGNAFGFLMAYERLTFPEAVKYLAERLGLAIPDAPGTFSSQRLPDQQDAHVLLSEVAVFYQRQLRQTPAAIEYLKQRGLSGEICKRYQIGYAPEGWDHLLRHLGDTPQKLQALEQNGLLIEKKEKGAYYDRFRHRIIFPIRNRQGQVIGFGGRVINSEHQPKYLNSPETPLFHKSEALYGLWEMSQQRNAIDRIIVVEGYMDVVALAQHDIPYSVATLGTSLTSQHVQILSRYTKTIIFCFDGDEAGKKAAQRALERVLSVIRDGMFIKFLWLPEGQDPDSFVRNLGAEVFLAQLEAATDFSEAFFQFLNATGPLRGLEERARVLQAAEQWFAKMPESALKRLMAERLSQMIQTTQRYTTRSDQRPFSTHTSDRVGRKPERKLSPLKQLLALLLQFPQIIGPVVQCPEWLNQVNSKGVQILKQVWESIKKQPKFKTANLLELWREEAFYTVLVDLAGHEQLIPEEGVIAEFEAILQHLYQRQLDRQIEKLMLRAKQNELSLEEKQHLQYLIQEQQRYRQTIQ